MSKKSEIAKNKPRNEKGKFVKKYQSPNNGLDYKTAANSSFVCLPEEMVPMPPNPAVTPIAPGVYHVNIYRSIASTPGGIYRNLDEALRSSPQTAKAMLNDISVTGPLFQRWMSEASYNDGCVAGDENDPEQIAVCEELNKEIKSIPRWTEFKRNLMWAAWYGKHTNVINWEFQFKEGKRKLTIKNWFPLIGDKLCFRNNGRMGYLVHMPTGYRDVVYTDHGMAELFGAEDMDCLVHHKYFMEDTTWDESMLAIGVEGFGYRHFMYWTYWLKQNLLEWALNAFQIFGAGGIRIAYFEAGNPASEQAVAQAMAEANGQNIILFPRPIGDEKQGAGLEIISPAGIDLSYFQHFIEDYFGKQTERLMLGWDYDTNRNDYTRLQQYDCAGLSETISRDLISVLIKWNHPEAMDWGIKYQISVPAADTSKALEAVQRAMECGIQLKSREVYSLLGFSMPTKNDKILVKPNGDAGIKKPESEVHNLGDQLA